MGREMWGLSKAAVPPPVHMTEPEVFIIESLRLEDEEKGYYEGKILADVLRMCGKKPIYYYCRTSAELQLFLLKFRDSGYRYLHISCHGGETDIETTLDQISYIELGEMMGTLLRNRRLFMSACEVGNELFAAVIAGRNKGLFSIAAPCEPIRFDHAVGFWTAFYVKLFSDDRLSMRKRSIVFALKALCALYGIGFYWSYYNAKFDKWESAVIRN